MNNVNGYKIINKINAGGSTVSKYIIEKKEKKYLLRIYDIRFMENRYKAFKNVKELYDNGISVPNIYEYGELDNLYGYAIFDWVEGTSIDKLTNDNYLMEKYGKEVARELLKLHNIKSQEEINVYDNFLNNYNKKINKIKELKIAIDYNIIELYIFDNINILKNIKSSIIHGDFDLNNIIVNNDKITFIDLDACKKDCAYVDLSTTCNIDNINFYTNLINEYFKENIPNDFWTIYNLYGTIYCLDYILYCARMNNKTIDNGIDKMDQFLEYNNNFQSLKPKWFNDKVIRKERI